MLRWHLILPSFPPMELLHAASILTTSGSFLSNASSSSSRPPTTFVDNSRIARGSGHHYSHTAQDFSNSISPSLQMTDASHDPNKGGQCWGATRGKLLTDQHCIIKQQHQKPLLKSLTLQRWTKWQCDAPTFLHLLMHLTIPHFLGGAAALQQCLWKTLSNMACCKLSKVFEEKSPCKYPRIARHQHP